MSIEAEMRPVNSWRSSASPGSSNGSETSANRLNLVRIDINSVNLETRGGKAGRHGRTQSTQPYH